MAQVQWFQYVGGRSMSCAGRGRGLRAGRGKMDVSGTSASQTLSPLSQGTLPLFFAILQQNGLCGYEMTHRYSDNLPEAMSKTLSNCPSLPLD